MGKTVLIVEDDERNMRYFSDLVTAFGHNVLKAGHAMEGIALARTHRPDLIFMDVGLPDIPGNEAVRLLKADSGLRDIPVVILTAYAMKHQVEEFRQCGCDELQTKPISPLMLRDLVDRYTARETDAPTARRV